MGVKICKNPLVLLTHSGSAVDAEMGTVYNCIAESIRTQSLAGA